MVAAGKNETRSPGVLVRVTKANGEPMVRIRVGEEAEKPAADMPRYEADAEFRISFDDITRGGLARLLGNMYVGKVSAPEEGEGERLTGSDRGTIPDLAAKYSLLVE